MSRNGEVTPAIERCEKCRAVDIKDEYPDFGWNHDACERVSWILRITSSEYGNLDWALVCADCGTEIEDAINPAPGHDLPDFQLDLAELPVEIPVRMVVQPAADGSYGPTVFRLVARANAAS